MDRLISFTPHSRISPGLQAILKRVGFAVLFFCVLDAREVFAQPEFVWTTAFQPRYLTAPWDMLTINGETYVAGFCQEDPGNSPTYGFICKISEVGQVSFVRQYSIGSGCNFSSISTDVTNKLFMGGSSDNEDGTTRNGTILASTLEGDSLWTFILEQGDDRTFDVSCVAHLSSDRICAIGSRVSPTLLGKSFVLLMLDTNGNELVRRNLGEGYGQFVDVITQFESENGNIVIVGNIWRNREPLLGNSIFALCVTPDGDSLWSQTYSFPGRESFARSAIHAPNANFYIGAVLGGADGGPAIITCDSLGDTIRTTQLYSTPHPFSGPTLGIQRSESTIYASYGVHTQYSAEQQFIVSLDTSGSVLGLMETFTGLDTSFTIGLEIMEDTTIRLSSNIVDLELGLIGYAFSIRNGLQLSATEDVLDEYPGSTNISISPNPSNAAVSIRLLIETRSSIEIGVFNVVGQRVLDVPVWSPVQGYITVPLDVSQLASGQYFINVLSESHSKTAPLTIIR